MRCKHIGDRLVREEIFQQPLADLCNAIAEDGKEGPQAEVLAGPLILDGCVSK
jgi:hypothetical protein